MVSGAWVGAHCMLWQQIRMTSVGSGCRCVSGHVLRHPVQAAHVRGVVTATRVCCVAVSKLQECVQRMPQSSAGPQQSRRHWVEVEQVAGALGCGQVRLAGTHLQRRVH